MAFITPELLTCIGIASAIGCSASGSAVASNASGTYMTRYNSSRPPTTTSSKQSYCYASFIPIIISGVLAIYGFIIAVLLCFQFDIFASSSNNNTLDIGTGYKNLAAGLSVGFSCMNSGSNIASYLQDYIYFYSNDPMTKKGTIVTTRIRGCGHDIGNYDSTASDGGSLVQSLLPSVDEQQSQLMMTGSNKLQLQQEQLQETATATSKVFPEPDIHLCLCLVYLEAIGLYGFVVALLLILS